MILQEAKQIEATILSHRRHIHQHPEPSFREHNTSKYIADYLTKLNISHHYLCDTGIVALIGDASQHQGRCVAFRAELDALPITENTGLPFASASPGLMHACGHDMHIAMLLGAAEILQNNVRKLHSAVKLIFQPGEEVLPGGAQAMIEQGCLQNPAPQAIFAGHIDPSITTSTFEAAPNAAMAATCEITITIKGTATHGSTPHLGSDPLVVAAAIINFAQTFIVRYNNPLQPAVLSICAANGGQANNAFPESVTLLGTLRTFDKGNRARLLDLLLGKVKQLCEVYDTQCDIDIVLGYPQVVNNPQALDIVKNCANAVPGCQFGICQPKMWAEDFAYYAEQIPACLYFIGCRPGALTDNSRVEREPSAPLHSNNLAPDEKALLCGTDIIVKISCADIHEL